MVHGARPAGPQPVHELCEPGYGFLLTLALDGANPGVDNRPLENSVAGTAQKILVGGRMLGYISCLGWDHPARLRFLNFLETPEDAQGRYPYCIRTTPHTRNIAEFLWNQLVPYRTLAACGEKAANKRPEEEKILVMTCLGWGMGHLLGTDVSPDDIESYLREFLRHKQKSGVLAPFQDKGPIYTNRHSFDPKDFGDNAVNREISAMRAFISLLRIKGTVQFTILGLTRFK